jgi:transcription initiation factor TFIID subunit 7
MKLAQRDELKEKQRLKKEGITIDAAEDVDFDNVGHDGEGDMEDDEDLFGDGPMDVG